MRPIDQQTPTYMPTANRPINAGTSMNDNTSRLDGVAKVTGAARYGRDMHLPNAIYIALVRCPYGAADLESSDAAAAKAVPGVLEVEVTGKEGKYHGQPIGHVAAESPLAMKRALRALNCTWKRKPVKTRISDVAPDMPAPEDKTKEILESAELKLEAVYSTPVQPHSSLETHGGVVDHKGDRATVYASTQGTSSVKDGLGDSLGLPQSAFEVVCEYVGGGFGSKLGGPGKEISTAARIAAKYKRPAYLFCNRSEEHLDTGNRPSLRALVRLGFMKDGTILGGEIHKWGGVGVGGGGGGASLPSGRYRLGDVKKSDSNVSTNGGGPRPARAPGNPQGVFVEELMLDEVAAMAGIDPLDLRRKLVTDDIYKEMFDLGARLIGWQDRRANGTQRTGLRTGFGVGSTNWGYRGPQGSAEVVINRDGSVEVRTGTQDIGTGQRTIMGIVAAEALGVPLRVVNVRIGHSTLPPGPGSGGSQTAYSTSPIMNSATRDARQQFLTLLAKGDGADAAEFDIKDGQVLRKGQPYLTWQEACAKLPNDGVTGKNEAHPDGGAGGSQGVQFVKVAVDVEAGVVHPLHVVAIQSCGRVVCRKTAESQIIGGVIQGLSYALFERQILDRNVGTMVNDNFEFYKVLGPMDMPHIEPVLWARGQTGVRSLGEPPIIPTAGATAGAIFNAIGRPVRDLPMTPDRLLAAMEGGAS